MSTKAKGPLRRDEVADYIRANPTLSAKQVAQAFGTSTAYVYQCASARGVSAAKVSGMTGRIVDYIQANPKATDGEAAQALDTSRDYVCAVRCRKRLRAAAPSKASLIIEALQGNPNADAHALASKLGVTPNYVWQVRLALYGPSRRRKLKILPSVADLVADKTPEEAIEALESLRNDIDIALHELEKGKA